MFTLLPKNTDQLPVIVRKNISLCCMEVEDKIDLTWDGRQTLASSSVMTNYEWRDEDEFKAQRLIDDLSHGKSQLGESWLLINNKLGYLPSWSKEILVRDTWLRQQIPLGLSWIFLGLEPHRLYVRAAKIPASVHSDQRVIL